MDAVSALLHEEELPIPVTPAGVLHWFRVQPERAHARGWVAEQNGEVVGWAHARFRWKTRARGVGEPWVFVPPRARRRGHGAALLDAAVRHLAGADARVLQTWTEQDSGRRFLEQRGCRPGRTERISVVDLTRRELRPPEPPARTRVVPLRALRDRTREVHALDAATSGDVPETFAEDDIRYEEWVAETLGHPQLSLDGSVVVLVNDRLVAFTLLEVDPEAGWAANEMTGTLPQFRGRGLARLAKLASLRWAAENGYRFVQTTNDERNTAMLRVNESLGYLAVGIETQYLLEP